MIFPILTFPYTSRILGPEGTGTISFATSFVGYFVLLASVGIPMFGIREIAKVRDDQRQLSKTTQELFILHVVTSVLIFIVFLILIFFNGRLHQEKSLFFIVSFSIILSSIGLDWLYQGLEKYTYITIRSIIFSTISTAAIFIFILQKEDYILSAAIGVFASLGSGVLNFYNARKILFRSKDYELNFKQYLKPLMKVYFMNFVISIYIQLDTVMLGFMSTAKNVGYYTIATKLTKMLLALVTSIGTVLLPRLSYYISNGKREEFDQLVKKSISLVLLLSIPIVGAIILVNKDIILIFGGSQFLPASQCIIITAPIILFIGLTNIIGIQVLYTLGKDNQVSFCVTFGALTSILLNFILIPKFDHIGAAIGTLMSEMVVFIIMIVVVNKTYKITFPINNILQYLFSTSVMITVMFFTQQFISLLWLRMIIVIPLGILIYFGILLFVKDKFVLEFFNNIKMKINV